MCEDIVLIYESAHINWMVALSLEWSAMTYGGKEMEETFFYLYKNT